MKKLAARLLDMHKSKAIDNVPCLSFGNHCFHIGGFQALRLCDNVLSGYLWASSLTAQQHI